MSETVQLTKAGESPGKPKKFNAAARSVRRLATYTVVRLLTLFIVVVIGVYLTILIANMGGYVDRIRSGAIREAVGSQILANPAYRQMEAAERNRIIDEQVARQEERLGLNRPFLVRSFDFLKDALSLNLGRSLFMSSDSGSREVRRIILERLPSTLVLFATADMILFFTALFSALALSRHYGSFVDRVIIALTPTSAAPAWFYGIFLLLIFAGVLKVLPFGGIVDAPPPANPLQYALSVARHLILPVSAWLLSQGVISIFSWRTFFMIYSSEDYVDMAKAKGLPDRMIERRYILRPTLPNIITSFALLLIAMWSGAIILETVFNWPGLGRLYNEAIGLNETSVIVGNTVIYGYLLAITVFLLEFVYALVDPRVKIGGGARQ